VFSPKAAEPQTKAAKSSKSKPTSRCLARAKHQLSHQLVANVPSVRHTIREILTSHEVPSTASWDFSNIPLSPPGRERPAQPLSVRSAQPGVMQPKLAIGPVNDPLEREADVVAERVMQMPDPALSISTGQEKTSRKYAACERETERRCSNRSLAERRSPLARRRRSYMMC